MLFLLFLLKPKHPMLFLSFLSNTKLQMYAMEPTQPVLAVTVYQTAER